MTDTANLRKQQYARFQELFALSRQRYLDNGGDSKHSNGSLGGNEYLTKEELRELFTLGRELSGTYIKDGYVHCQGRSWKLPANSPLLKEQVEAES